MLPETVICWRWKPKPGYRSTYAPSTVRALRDMVAKHYRHPHRFVCVDDAPEEIDADIETIRDFGDFADLPSPHGKKNPSCYRRLRLFHPDSASLFGTRFVSLDLDCVIVGDLAPLWDRPEELVCWGDTNPQPGSYYNGSMILMTAGARPRVWTEFDPRTSPDKALAAKAWGSDQGWLSYCLGPGEARWGIQHGVYSFRNHIEHQPGKMLPADARVVMFHGRVDPWMAEAQQLAWVRAHYPMAVAA